MIVTFYSIVDERARTALLERVATILSDDSDVLAVDFDVVQQRLSTGQGNHPGLLDVMDVGDGSIVDHWRQDDQWVRLFAEQDGARKVEALRGRWLATYDYVLVDSAAGTGPVSGVCTVQLADVIVLCVDPSECGPGDYSPVVEEVRRRRESFGFDRPPATVIPVLTKATADGDVVGLSAYCMSWLPRSASAGDVLRSLTLTENTEPGMPAAILAGILRLLAQRVAASADVGRAPARLPSGRPTPRPYQVLNRPQAARGKESTFRSGPPSATATDHFASAKIVITGGLSAGKSTFIHAISEITPLVTEASITRDTVGIDSMGPSPTTTTASMDFGRLSLTDDLVLYLFGTPGQDRFAWTWDALFMGAVGAVIVVDTRRIADSFPVLDHIESRGLPYLLAINQFDGATRHDSDDVRQALDVGYDIPVLDCDVRQRGLVHEVLVALVDHVVSQRRSRSTATV